MRNLKKTLSVFLVVLMLLTSAPLEGFASLEIADFNMPTFVTEAVSVVSSAFSGLTLQSSAAAEEYTEDIFTYSVENGKATIIDVASTASGEIAVPEAFGDYPVVKIGTRAFESLTKITSVIIPSSVKAIYPYAFNGCTSLNSVTLSEGLEVVGYSAFTATIITHIDIPSTVYMLNFDGYSDAAETITNYRSTSAFYGANKLKTVAFADGTTKIGSYSLYDCPRITNVVIPDSVSFIGEYAFAKCSALKNVTLPSGIDRIYSYVFQNCTSLTSVEIHSDIRAIYHDAFNGCSTLSEVVLNEGLEVIGYRAFSGTAITEITIPASVWELNFDGYSNINETSVWTSSTSAFNGATKLKKVIFTDGISKIDEYALYGCSAIETIVLPDSVSVIAERAFSGCASLKEITIPQSIDRISYHCYEGCTSLTSIEIPAHIKAIYPYAFVGCTSLSEVKLNDGLEVIGCKAFEGTSITEITIPSTVWAMNFDGYNNATETSIYTSSSSAFQGANKLEKVIFAEGTEKIGSYSLSNCTNVEDIIIPNSVKVVDKYAFSGCSSLADIILPANADRINEGVFLGCTSLTSVEIPASVKAIYPYAFRNCTSLSEVKFNDGLQVIGYRAFEGTIIPEVTIPSTVWAMSFERYSNDDETSIYTSSTSAFQGANKLKKVTFAEGVKKIERYSLANCSKLEEIIIPDTVEQVNEYAFSGCTSLDNIILPAKLDRISYGCYQGCTSLSEIEIPSNIKAIYPYAFYNCNILGDVKLNEGLEVIGHCAFRGTAIEEIRIPSTVFATSFESYRDEDEVYINTSGTSAFYDALSLTTVEFAEGVKEISAYGFNGCASIENIILPDSLEKINNYAFASCTGLEEVTIPVNVTEVGERAFEGCSNMKNLSILAANPVIRAYAFRNCSSLDNLIFSADCVRSTEKGRTIDPRAFTACNVPSKLTVGADTYDLSYEDGVLTVGGTSYALVEVPEGITWSDASDECLAQAGHLMTVSHRGEELIAEYLLSKTSATSQVWLYGTDETKESKWAYPNGDTYSYTNWGNGCPNNRYANEDYLVLNYNGGNSYWDDLRITDTVKGYICEWNSKTGPDVSVKVIDENGTDVTENVNIEWYRQGSLVSNGSTIKNCDIEKAYSYRVILGEEYGRKYSEPANQAVQISEENNEFVYQLQPFTKITVSGSVFDSFNNKVANANVKFTQTFNGKYEAVSECKTDANGRYTITVYNVPTDILFSSDECYDKAVSGAEAYFTAASVELEPVVLKALASSRITLSIMRMQAALDGESGEATPVTNTNGLEFSLYNKTDSADIKNFTVQYPYIILEDQNANPGDVIETKVVDTTGSVTADIAEFVLDENCNSNGVITLRENGKIKIENISGEPGIFMVFDATGKYVNTYNAQPDAVSDVLTSGEYSVVFMKKTTVLRRVSSIDKLSAIGLNEGKDYIRFTSEVNNGIISLIDGIAIPDFDETRLYYTDSSKTEFTSSRYELNEGKLITLKSAYKIKRDYETSGQYVTIVLPVNVAFIEDSVTLNGVLSEYVFDEVSNTVKVFTNLDEAIIRCSAAPTEKGEAIIDSYLGFTNNGTDVLQPVGSVKLDVEAVSMTVPTITGRQKISVSGKGIATSTVDIFVDGEKIASTESNRAGSWSADVTLPGDRYEYRDYELYAVLTSKSLGYSIASDKVKLTYDPDYVSLSKITMINTAHDGRTREFITEFDFINPTNEKLSYNYWPAYPTFTFKVEFTTDNPNLISDVFVVTSNVNDELIYVPCTFDASTGFWVGTQDYRTAHDKPTGVTAIYTYNEVEKKSLLIDELSMATDLVCGDVSVSRVFLSDADTFSKLGMFGYGWQNDFELKAQFITSGTNEYILVGCSGVTILFEKQPDGSYLCHNDSLIECTVKNGCIKMTTANKAVYEFNKNGRIEKMSNASGITYTMTYTKGLLTKVASSTGKHIIFTYNNNLVSKATSSDGETVKYTYSGSLLTGVTYDGKTVSYDYWTGTGNRSENALKSIEMINGSDIYYEYDSYGRVTSLYKGDGLEKVTYEYTGATKVKETNAVGLVADYVFDENGYVLAYSDSANTAYTIEYSENMQVTKITYSDGSEYRYKYDSNSNLIENSFVDENGTVTVASRAEYDPNGNISAIIDGNDVQTDYENNEIGLPTKITYPDGTYEEYTYDSAYNLVAFTDRMGNTSTFSYSGDNLTQVNNAGESKITYAYDSLGRVISATQNGKVTTLTYDNYNHITSVTYPGGKTISYTYDSNGLISSVTDSEGFVTKYFYDSQGRVWKLTDKSGALITTYSYNSDSTIKEKKHGNGTYTTYTYNNGNITGIYNYSSAGKLNSFFEYEYDTVGNIIKKTDNDGDYTYKYDRLGQLVKIVEPDGTVITYTYDGAGNRTTETVNGVDTYYDSNELNQYTTAGSKEFSYDANGNLISVDDGQTVYTYTYDSVGRVRKMTDGVHTYEYGYDIFGNRNTVSVDGAVTEYVWSPLGNNNILTSYSSDGKVSDYIIGTGLTSAYIDGQMYYYDTDILGSVSALTNSTGTVANVYTYDTSGAITRRSESVFNPFTYVGAYGVVDDGNGLYHARKRFIDPELGRFLSPDTNGQLHSINVYSYANNNPVSQYDFTGDFVLTAALVAGLIGGTVSVAVDMAYDQITKGHLESWQTYAVSFGTGFIADGLTGGLGTAAKIGTKIAIQSGKGFLKSTLTDIVNGRSIDWGKAIDTTIFSGLSTFVSDKLTKFVSNKFGNSLKGLITNLTKKNGFLGNLAGAGYKFVNGLAKKLLKFGANKLTGSIWDLLKKVFGIDDPSGYVYEAVHSNRVQGVTATAYTTEEYYDDYGELQTETVFWDATEFDQINPLITDYEGRYAWDVPSGKWQVKYEKEGYITTYSEWLDVPPPQTEVNVSIVSTAAPEVDEIYAYTGDVEIHFSQYMDISSVNSENVTVKSGSKTVKGTISPVNAESSGDAAGIEYASVFIFVPSADLTLNEKISVTVDDVINYAGNEIELADSRNVRVNVRPTAIESSAQETVDTASTVEIPVKIDTGAAASGSKLIVYSSSPSICTVLSEEVTVGEDGTAVITVKTNLPGYAEIIYELAGTSVTATTGVTVNAVEFSGVVELESLAVGNVPEKAVPVGSVVELAPAFTPVFTTERDVEWSSSNPEVASVSENGLVAAHNIGTTTITLKSLNKKFTATCEIKVECNHQYTDAVVNPGCVTKGYTSHTCSVCGYEYADSFVNATGHKETNLKAVAATCTETGLTEGKHCSVCNEVLVAQKTVNKKAHTNKTTTTKATLTANGKTETKCTVCGTVSKTTAIYAAKTITLSKTKYTYNGKAQTPTVTVKDSKGNILKKDTDYTVKYALGRKSTGKYAVTITFKGNYSGTKTLYFNILPSKTSKVTTTSTTTSIKATWKKVTGASGYKVELLNSKGKVVKTYTTTKTAYTFKKLSKVTTYKIKVTAYKTIDKKNVYSTSSVTVTTSTAPSAATLSKVTAGSKCATLVWKTVSKASGYEVQYSTSSKFKSAKKSTVSKGSSKKTTIKKLTKGKKYYFKVRAYKTVGSKKVYGAWSAVKSVKVK